MPAPAPAIPTWNVLVTAVEGQRDTLLYALRPLARFRRGGYPNVAVATIEDVPAFLVALREALEASLDLRISLGKVVPMDATVRFPGPDAFVDTVMGALEPHLPRLRGASFFVRVSRRGFRHALVTTDAERAIGARVYAWLEAQGDQPVVRFDDPDVVIAIETIRDEAGIGVLGRGLRTTYSFVRIR
jgi:tRNA(Ser,Leu) C12 N-acetylase TAN1